LPPAYPPAIFGYAGLDFVLDGKGSWWFLEANDHPVGLAIADRLAAGIDTPAFGPSGVDALARTLAERADPHVVALLPPDAFRVAPSCGERRLHGHSSFLSDDGRPDLTLEEFDSLIEALDAQGARWILANADELSVRRGRLFAGKEARVGALYRRHQGISAATYVVPTINDIRLRRICPDKLWTAEVVAAAASSVRQPDTILLDDAPASDAWFDRRMAGAPWLITKPRQGTASHGLRRERAADTRARAGELTEPTLAQDWIEPASVERAAHSYRFDVRVFVIAGRPLAALGRTAAAPTSGVASDSPLAWLTTTGPLAALARGSSKEASPAGQIALTPSVRDDLDRQSRLVVAALESAASELSIEEAVSSLKPYQELAGISGEMRVIALCGRTSSAA